LGGHRRAGRRFKDCQVLIIFKAKAIIDNKIFHNLLKKMTTQTQNNIRKKIIKGLELNYLRLLAEKRAKNQPLVIMRNNKIQYVKM